MGGSCTRWGSTHGLLDSGFKCFDVFQMGFGHPDLGYSTKKNDEDCFN